MAERLTRGEVEALVRQANSPDLLIAEKARLKLVALSRRPNAFPDPATQAWVSEIVRSWMLGPG